MIYTFELNVYLNISKKIKMHTKTLFAKLVIPNIGYAESAEWINTSKVIFIAFMHKCLA